MPVISPFAQNPTKLAPLSTDAPSGQPKKGTGGQTVPVMPFGRSSKWHTEVSNTQAGISLTTASQVFNFPITSYGYLSGLLVTAVASGGTGSAAVAFEDAPWSIFSQIQVSDVNGVPIYQLSGYNAYLAAKFGGYRPYMSDQSTNTKIFQAVQNTGNFTFILPIWFEFGLDGMGCLPNQDASARYNLQITVAAAGTASTTGPVYTTLPTGLPTLAITVEPLCRSQPPAQDMFGNKNSTSPPAVGTVEYWTVQTQSGLANGQNTVQLTRVGNLIRNHILVFRNSNGTRATAESGGDVPVLMEFDWDVGPRYVNNVATQRAFNGIWAYGVDVPNGVIAYPNTLDPDKLPFSEFGDEWMATVGATKLTLRFTTTAGGGTLSIITNDFVPANPSVYAAPALVVG